MADHCGIFDTAGARALARKRLPRMIFDFIDGASGDERALKSNVRSLGEIQLMPRVLRDVSTRDISDLILGMKTDLPFGIAPMGMCNLTWPGADRALARMAARRKMPLCTSTAASTTLENVIEMAEGNAWFQLYPGQSEDFVNNLVDRSIAAGYRHLVVTVDVPILSVRNRERSAGFGLSPRIDIPVVWDFISHPRWSLSSLLAGIPKPMNFLASSYDIEFDRQGDRSFADWNFFTRLRDRWPHKLIVKGIQSPQDAKRIASLGADAIYVSNHGGRQLNASPASITSLPVIREAVGDDMTLVFDGGVRHGDDVIKARIYGADFVMVGRPYLYGLGAAGARGPERITDILAEEASVALGLLGETALPGLGAHNLADVLPQNRFDHTMTELKVTTRNAK